MDGVMGSRGCGGFAFNYGVLKIWFALTLTVLGLLNEIGTVKP